MKRIGKLLLGLSFFLFGLAVFSPVYADYCATSVTVDTYVCPEYGVSNPNCNDPPYPGRETYSCNTQTCKTWSGVCSSNDLPLYCYKWTDSNPDIGTYCYIGNSNCSKASCNVICDNVCSAWTNGTCDCKTTGKPRNQTRTCPKEAVDNGCAVSQCVADSTCCTATNPAAPTLVSPANWATGLSTTVNLDWNATTSWGTGCPQNNTYKIYISTSSNPAYYTYVGSGTTIKTFTAAVNTKYYWKIVADNGSKSASSPIWSFTTTIPAPSCTLSLTSSSPTNTVPIGSNITLTATATNVQNGTVTKVTFSSSDITKVSVNPLSDTSSPYTTWATGVSSTETAVMTPLVIDALATMTGGGTCSASLSLTVPVCTVSIPNLTLEQGQTSPLTATLTNITPSSVTFSSNNANVTVTSPDTSSPYQTNVTAVSAPGATLTASAIYAGAAKCSGNSAITVTVRGPWWQVVDGDVQTNGDLGSDIPSSYYFDLKGLGGFPGVPKYGGSTSLTSANVSEKHWWANSSYTPPNNKIQNYAYFTRLIPEDTTINAVSGTTLTLNGQKSADGYYWYEYDGTLTGLPLSISSPILLADGTKVILLVTGADLNIEKSITYTSGKSIFVALVDKNININPSVGGAAYDLQGFFLADENISTGISSTSLHLKGSVAALGTLSLQRNLGGGLNPTTASEVFEYDPSTIFLFPPTLSTEKIRWKEVAP